MSNVVYKYYEYYIIIIKIMLINNLELAIRVVIDPLKFCFTLYYTHFYVEF